MAREVVTPVAVLDAVRRSVGAGLHDLARIWRGVVGEDAYERYCDHVRAERAAGEPDHPCLTEREFWRDRTDRQDANPQGRCC
ncbi:YbdD/YjiX family protein [Cellulomonas aerilata]|uniref:DUF466 domain-containing protein n=1 Tax=Cellulomonas aerilata TaxID=515326 RepID=A0A512DCI5_9CELL|nr:YbdD/YjiX family protein [Cellulomonas aerilata]GEO34198.1 hypothetical protein CAE01nite_19230 [Cellulomonas aerilata]